MLSAIRNFVVALIDIVHKPFARWIPAQTFRYLACGGGNTVLGLVLFSVVYNFSFHGKDTIVTDNMHLANLYNIQVTSRIATFFITTCVTFPIGFLLSSFVVFPESQLRGRVQLFRYATATLTFILLAYVLTKIFAIMLPFVRADIANIFVNAIIAFLSYLSQRFFTFKITPETDIAENAFIDVSDDTEVK